MAAPMISVLLLDDDATLRDVLTTGLSLEGFAVQAVADPRSALARLAADEVDVFVLDVRMPGMSGLDVLAEVRRHADVPVLLLTGDDDADVLAQGFGLGADDFVRKPTTVLELALRLRALHRRSARHPHSGRIVEGDLIVDLVGRSVSAHSRVVPLTSRELDLLVHLLERPGEACSRESLLRSVWASSSAWQSAATVTEHVRRIRQKLASAGIDAGITSLRGAGYRYDGAKSLVA